MTDPTIEQIEELLRERFDYYVNIHTADREARLGYRPAFPTLRVIRLGEFEYTATRTRPGHSDHTFRPPGWERIGINADSTFWKRPKWGQMPLRDIGSELHARRDGGEGARDLTDEGRKLFDEVFDK